VSFGTDGKMLERVTLEVRSRNDIQAAARVNGATISITDCRPLDREGMVMLLKVAGSPKAVRGTVSTLRRMTGVRHAYQGETGHDGTRVLVVLNKPGVCRASRDSVVLCLDCPFNSTEVPAKWQVVTRRAGDLDRILARLGKDGIGAKVTDISPIVARETLTAKQKEILGAAVAMGYFDFPRKASLRDLSEIIGAKPLELSRILRDLE
jgi:hypothetical protein